VSEKPMGFITDFDKTKDPVSTAIKGSEIDYKITTVHNQEE